MATFLHLVVLRKSCLKGRIYNKHCIRVDLLPLKPHRTNCKCITIKIYAQYAIGKMRYNSFI